MTEIQRIKKVVDWLIFIEFAKNNRDLAKKLGYKETYLSQTLTSQVPLSDKFISKLCSSDDRINANWILCGEGKMLKDGGEASADGYIQKSNMFIMETTTINERLQLLTKELGYKSVRQFSIKIGIAQTSLNAIFNGAEPKFSTLNKILEVEPSISAEWLMTGKGSMLKNSENHTIINNGHKNTSIAGSGNHNSNISVGNITELLKASESKDEQISLLIEELSKQREQIGKLIDKLIN